MSPQRTVEMDPAPASPSSLEPEVPEFKGSTVFAASPAPTFRYSLTLKTGKLRIWLENCESKEQWRTTELSLKDYVDLSNSVIPEATAADYCFHDVLDGACGEVDDISSTFHRRTDGTFQLEITVKTQVLKRSRVAKYLFTLEPISVERIDVLESKMRDLQEEVKVLHEQTAAGSAETSMQEEMKKLRRDLDGREAEISELRTEVKALREDGQCPLTIQAEATTRVRNLATILWTKVDGGSNVNGVDGIIRNLKPGTYQVTMVVNCLSNQYNVAIELKKSAKCLQMANCAYGGGYIVGTSLSCVTRMEKGDYMSVNCGFELSGTSYLTLLRLGE